MGPQSVTEKAWAPGHEWESINSKFLRERPPIDEVTTMKVYSERLFLKYLFSNHGMCFGVDLKDRSYLFLVSKAGVMFQRRPVGDKVVENLNYEIPEIVKSLLREPR